MTPSTDLGKLVTILYALLGIPLMFIYMANIGTVLASSFKFVYSKLCRQTSVWTFIITRNCMGIFGQLCLKWAFFILICNAF